MHQTCDGFYFILKKHLKLSQKNNFLGHFERFLFYALLGRTSYTPIFGQIKHLIEVHNCGKFHYCSTCGCQVINFQMFSWRCSIHEIGPSGGSSLLKFRPEVFSHEIKTVSELSFKTKCLSGNGTHPKFTVIFLWVTPNQ